MEGYRSYGEMLFDAEVLLKLLTRKSEILVKLWRLTKVNLGRERTIKEKSGREFGYSEPL